MARRALISVYDKAGIVEFAKELVKRDWEILSTGGTAKKLESEGIEIIDLESVTDFPECFDGRVKTLHPKIHGGILNRRDNESDQIRKKELDIHDIDLVVNTLYPFKETVKKQGVSHAEIIENIDIGGPSMIRAAAKNYKDCYIVTDLNDYDRMVEVLDLDESVQSDYRLYLASKAFHLTAHYDALISSYFGGIVDTNSDTLTMTFEKISDLRYGENPHQKGSFYREVFEQRGSLADAIQLHGKELSFNNIHDTNGALDILKEYEGQKTIVAVKHANPCGIGTAESLVEAFEKAYKCDPLSIFGGIIASNEIIDLETAQKISKIFIEVVVAPDYEEEALALLTKKKNIRVLKLEDIVYKEYKAREVKKVLGGLLVQDRDDSLIKDGYTCVTDREPSESEMTDLIFAWKAVKHAKSNGIAMAKDGGTVAIGPGQVSRIWAVENCIKQGGEMLEGAVMASDAFFPFDDCVAAAHKAGITAIIQPGGSVRDEESIKKANEHGIAMIFTGMRHFKH